MVMRLCTWQTAVRLAVTSVGPSLEEPIREECGTISETNWWVRLGELEHGMTETDMLRKARRSRGRRSFPLQFKLRSVPVGNFKT